jgi:hypothetical protein
MKWWFTYLYLPGILAMEYFVWHFITPEACVDDEKLEAVIKKAMVIKLYK